MVKKRTRYGWIPDVPDQRDFMFRAIRLKVKLPLRVDLRGQCPLVEDQGQLGSCTANALAGNVEFLDNQGDGQYTDVSRLFIYYNERVLMGTVDTDSGATLRDGVKTLVKNGVCGEKQWPYDISRFTLKPSAACFKDALKHRVVSYHRLVALDEMLGCLAEGFPFVFGFTVYESFETAQVARTGVARMPKQEERVLGGHAVMAVGYDMKVKRFVVRNSWGTRWGQQGYFTMPFEYLENLARDFWTIRK